MENEKSTSWRPIFKVGYEDGDRRVIAIVDWEGGVGQKPKYPLFVAAHGLVENVSEAQNYMGQEKD